MKFPAAARKLFRRSLGMGRAESIRPEVLEDLASREDILVIGVGIVNAGSLDPRLPGEQRTASLVTIASVVADIPRQRVIALHCG